MAASVILIFLGAFIFSLFILQKALPGFASQQKYSKRTLQIASELSTAGQQKGLENFLLNKVVPWCKKILGIEYILGPKMKNMVEVVGEYPSVEAMLVKKLIRSAIFALPTLFLLVISPTLLITYPVAVGIAFYRDVKDTKKSFEKLQREITKDLPMLIDKLMIALETGKPFIQVFQEVEQTSGPKLKHLLRRLNANMQYMRTEEALEIFAKETTVPVMLQFSTAVKIGIQQGYESAAAYFDDIKVELRQLRRVALEELTKGKPEQAQLYTFLMIIVALGSVIFVLVQVFGKLQQIF
ncbi:hypothetical protein WJ0W_007113 [Paenibacillus melissococcoides]|uniref:Type II secretion system protein GspF domain-containing protein n=1 Tax=Paenibacillus melissococcoides TaxID=2912268 RepID=A0ABM9GAJ8_9BACL|nr:hypothetical protein [Paenibacillus melissococcoides]CAH8248445.1 hypothetical protein WJ0W_007113 [Paenibacillus melissococcoides]CAH8722069.1 hypothetical protein HTL2_006677 [Paenibacillus melissococcoides]CAH8722093.1 hypothetical protein WDD9_006616 [Paenibacillus melissococcoides]